MIIRDIFFLFLNETICCDLSCEPSRRDETVQMRDHNVYFFNQN